MKILILGCNGFIGSYLVEAFLTDRHEVWGCDIRGKEHERIHYCNTSLLSDEFDHFFSENFFDFCINASGSGDVGFSIAEPVRDFELNTASISKMLDLIRRIQPDCKYLHISSAAVYGNPASLPVNEDAANTPLSPYGWHKLLSEQICKEYSQVFGLKIAIIRPFSVYGNGLKKQLLWDICRKLSVADNISLFGTGNESRDFIHITDLVEAILKIIAKGSFEAEIYNIACGEEISIRQVAAIFTTYYPGNKTIVFSGEVKPGDPLNWQANIDKIKKIDFAPKMNLEQGIESYIKWYKESTNA